jgi:methylphosphotriester-DNA--protein-cysteine methyltransferase
MKKAIAITFVLMLFLFLTSSVTAAEFWASKNSNKYHYPTCKWAQKIKPNNLVKFSTPGEATKAGYQPCKVCKPAVASNTENTPEAILTKAI